jgi:tRNA (Thr-GGU) A37 N-methylase
MDITLTSIGVIHSPFTDSSQAPIQSSRSTTVGSVEVFPQFVAGLRDLEEFCYCSAILAVMRAGM